jgi:hypothetical protein
LRGEITRDGLHCTTLAGEIISEHSRDISPGDQGQRRIACLKYLPPRFVERDVSSMSGELQRKAS